MHMQGNRGFQMTGDIAAIGAGSASCGTRRSNSAEIDCPSCHVSISPLSTVCRHCRTNVLDFRASVERDRFLQLTRRAASVGVVGAIAGFMACFLGADVLPAWFTTASAYLGAGGAALTAMSVAAKP